MSFLIVSALSFNGYAVFMRKNLTRIEMLTTTFFAMTLQDNVDIFLDLKLNWYGYFTRGVQWETMIAIFGIYPAVNVIFLNYYPFRRGVIHKVVYITAASAFAIIYEWAAVKSGYFYHNQWKYWHSAICYPILFCMLVLITRLTRKYAAEACEKLRQDTKQRNTSTQ